MNLQLDNTRDTFLLRDGNTSWNSVAQEALNLWNVHLTRVQFASYTSTAFRRDGNDTNEVFFSNNIYGHRFGSYVLAVTTAWRIGSERVEGDTIFNSGIDWNSYRGPLDSDEIDFRRVATHEFGHTLGIDHPDESKQVEVAIMNSTISDLEVPAEDDIRGARVLYPPEGSFALNYSVEPPEGGSVIVIPTSVDGRYPAGTVVTLTARPARRFRFNHWDGDDITSARRLRVVVVDDTTIVAEFSTNTAPVVLTQPRSQFTSVFETTVLRAQSRGAKSLQWQQNGLDIPAATNATLVLTPFGHEQSGLYTLKASNASGSTTSRPARIIVDGY